MRCPPAFRLALFVIASTFLAAGAFGADFQVNTYTGSNQLYPAVGRAANGSFVVVWESQGHDGQSYGIFAQRFSSSGTRVGSDFQVNSYTVGAQRIPALAMNDAGAFVVVWRSGANQDGSDYGIFGRRYDSSGTPQATEFLVNAGTTLAQTNPDVAIDDQGEFVAVWESGGDIFGRRFGADGTPLAGDFLVNLANGYTQREPAVANDSDGDFIVSWDSQSDGSSYGLNARRFGSNGAALASEFQVNTYTTFGQIFSTIGTDADGAFVVSWQSSQDGSAYGIFARRFSSAGAPLAIEFQVNQRTLGDQTHPSLDVDADGAFLATWTESNRDGSFTAVVGRRFDAAGVGGADFVVNSHTLDEQRKPSVALGDDGGYVVAWESAQQDGFGFGIFASRVAALAKLDIDGDGDVTPLTDGLLFLRHQFLFSDSALIGGVVNTAECTRCTSGAIDGYLDSLGLQRDIDGNNVIEPLADGLLVLRRAFGFSGTSLTNGAVGAGCARCDAASLEPHIDGLFLPPNPV